MARALEERRRLAMRRAVGEHPSHEAIPERGGQGGEPLGPADLIALEAIGHDRQVFALQPLPDGRQFIGRDVQPARHIERQRWLGQHRCQH